MKSMLNYVLLEEFDDKAKALQCTREFKKENPTWRFRTVKHGGKWYTASIERR